MFGSTNASAALDIARIGQALDRHVDEGRIGEEERPVGIGEAARFRDPVNRVGAGLQRGHVLRFQHAHDLLHGDLARTRRTHAADPVDPIGAADGVPLLDLVGLEVVQGHVARIRRMAGDGRHDVLGDLAGVEGIRTFVGDCAQGLGEGRVLENGPDRLRLAVGLVEIGAGDRIVLKEFLLRQEPVEARRDRKAVLREAGRGLDHLRPGELAPVPVRGLKKAQGARHADRAAAHHRIVELHRLAVRTEKALGLCGRRRHLAPVERRHGRSVPEDHEGAAADAGALRLDEIEDELNGNRGVDGAAAGGKNLPAGLGGQRIGRGNHVLRCGASGFERASRGCFRGRGDGLGQDRGGQGHAGKKAEAPETPAKSALRDHADRLPRCLRFKLEEPIKRLSLRATSIDRGVRRNSDYVALQYHTPVTLCLHGAIREASDGAGHVLI